MSSAAKVSKPLSESDRDALRALLAELEKLQEKHRREIRYVELKADDPELRQALVDGLTASHHHRLVPYLQRVLELKKER